MVDPVVKTVRDLVFALRELHLERFFFFFHLKTSLFAGRRALSYECGRRAFLSGMIFNEGVSSVFVCVPLKRELSDGPHIGVVAAAAAADVGDVVKRRLDFLRELLRSIGDLRFAV